jgi:hypothetical protein
MRLLQYKHTVASYEPYALVLLLIPRDTSKTASPPSYRDEQAAIAQDIGLDYIGCEGKILSVFN